jgi:alanyl-tRNA synthetase
MYFTVVLKLDPARLYATYFGGDDKLGLPADSEAKAKWETFLPADHVRSSAVLCSCIAFS